MHDRRLRHSHVPQPPPQVQSLPSPPQHDQTFASMPTEYHHDRSNTPHGPPLSPPASEGLMSPGSHSHHDFQDKLPSEQSMSAMWMATPYSMKPEDSSMPLPMHETPGASSPPTLFIEDILRSEDPNNIPGIGGGYMEDHGFHDGFGGASSSGSYGSKKEIDQLMAPAPNSYSSPPPSAAARVRKKRHLTQPSEANYHCQKCGKYFSRIWNFNAHRETHDPDRPRPHACPVPECGKAFVRRTDLTRHQQCVHAKDKKFRCELCSNMFARKDTLRRHEDDGCPKRVDIPSRLGAVKGKPIIWNSHALNFYSAMQRRDEAFQNVATYDQNMRAPPSFDVTGMSTSHLPPLSDIVPLQKGPLLWG
ncbi:hypothetical protein RUND412_001747 [Rhizina undulata]